MILLSAQRSEVQRVPFLSPQAAAHEWDAIAFFDSETRKLQNPILFFETIAAMKCPRDMIGLIDDNPMELLRGAPNS